MKKEATVNFKKPKLMKTLKSLTIILVFATTICTQAQNRNTKKVSFSVDQDGISISGNVKVSTEFVYMGYPYLKIKYSDLEITAFTYKGETYNDYWSPDYLQLPFYPDTRSYYIETETHISMAVEDYDGSPTQRLDVNWGQNAYLEAKIYPVTDTYSNDKIDSYFKELSSDKYSDEDFWLKSYIEGIRITGISPNIIKQMTQIIDTH